MGVGKTQRDGTDRSQTEDDSAVNPPEYLSGSAPPEVAKPHKIWRG